MNRKTIAPEHVRELARNEHVSRAGAKSVRYTKKFRIAALKWYHEEGMSAVAIFEAAGFDLGIIGIRAPNRLMHQWGKALEMIEKKGSFEEAARNSGLAKKHLRTGSTLRKLKAKVAYLEAENDFLADLRARRNG